LKVDILITLLILCR